MNNALLRTVVAIALVGFVGCEESPCGRLGVRDNKLWIRMDCPANDVRVQNSCNGSFEFACVSDDDEHYSGTYSTFSCAEPLEHYGAVVNEEGCCWSAESGASECCIEDGSKEYGDCDSGGETTVIYY